MNNVNNFIQKKMNSNQPHLLQNKTKQNKNKKTGQDGFTNKSYPTSKKKIMLILPQIL